MITFNNLHSLTKGGKMRKFISFIFGVVIGSLVGATLSLLFAPESGANLRLQIRERAGAFTSEVRQAVNSKRIELQNRLDNLRAPKAS